MTELMANTTCRICGSNARRIFSAKLIGLPVQYFECLNCDYVQTENPYWLDRAYAMAINKSDTGIMVRNQINARITLATMYILGGLKSTVVDYAGGYGILVRMLRDKGVEALWSDKYCQNLLANGFEYSGEKAELVTAFEVFEHLVSPEDELNEMLNIAPNVLFSTDIISNPAPNHDDWWYYGKDHGQHIGFFRLKTLRRLARLHGKYFVSNGKSYHLISDKPVSSLAWKTLIRFNFMAPIIIRCGLESKTWKDHCAMLKNDI